MADIHIWLHALDIYCPQRSWGKVIFSEVCVKNSVHDGGGGVWADKPPGSRNPLEQTPPGADTPEEQTPPEQCMLGDTGNKRAVRILL